jgi:hypothetical protein
LNPANRPAEGSAQFFFLIGLLAPQPAAYFDPVHAPAVAVDL